MSDPLKTSDFLGLLLELEAKCRVQPDLNAELQEAQTAFHKVSAWDVEAKHRFREWFLLERVAQSLGAPPAVAWAPEASPKASLWHSLLDSFLGVFQSMDSEQKGFPLLEDLWTGRQIRLQSPNPTLGANTLVIGRVAVGGKDYHLPLPGTSFFAMPGLADALAQDLSKIKAAQPRARLSQFECESLLLPFRTQSGPNLSPERASAALEQLLRAYPDWSLQRLLFLVEEDGMQEALSHLAFATDIDLEKVRRYLASLEAPEAPVIPPSPEPVAKQENGENTISARKEALDAFAQNRSAGQSLEESFLLLEQSLDLPKGASNPYCDALEDAACAEEASPERIDSAQKEEGGLALWLASFLWDMEQKKIVVESKTLQAITRFLNFLQELQEGVWDLGATQQYQVFAHLCQLPTVTELEARMQDLEVFLDWLQQEQGASVGLPEEAKLWLKKVVLANHLLAQSATKEDSLAVVQKEIPLRVETESGEAAPTLGWPDGVASGPSLGDRLGGCWLSGVFHIASWYPQSLLPPSEVASLE